MLNILSFGGSTMRKRGLLLAACLLMTTSLAFSQVKFGFGPNLGIDFASFPKPADQLYGFGWHFGAHGEVEIIKYVGIRLGFDYSVFASDKAKFGYTGGGVPIPTSDISGGNARTFSILVTGVGKLPLTGWTPYGLFGFGIHISSVSDVSVTYQGQVYNFPAPSGSTDFGIHFGVGSEVKVSKNIGIFGDFKVMLIFSSGSTTSIFPFNFGMNYWL
jgi:hypothetical protein